MITKELLDFIKNLSETDVKNLSQKVLKVFEEGGELAKIALPYDNAYATRHRFVTKEKILEEVSDVILAALSVGYDVGMTHQELIYFLVNKSNYWASLQKQEQKLKNNIPFEIHLTVKNSNNFNIQNFVNDCAELSVKPIILDLHTSNSCFNDIMTSSIHTGDNRSVFEYCENIN